jgi:hypothetical protein
LISYIGTAVAGRRPVASALRARYHSYSGMKNLMSEFHRRFVRLWEGLSHRSQGKLDLSGNVRLLPCASEH